MKRFFALLLAVSMLSALAVPISAAEATYKVAGISQVAYLADDGRLDLSKSVSRVPYGETMYFPLLNGGNSAAVKTAEESKTAAESKLTAANKTLSELNGKKNAYEKALEDYNKAVSGAGGDLAALQRAVNEAKAEQAAAQAALAGLTQVPATEIARLTTAQTAANTALTQAEALKATLDAITPKYNALQPLDSGEEAKNIRNQYDAALAAWNNSGYPQTGETGEQTITRLQAAAISAGTALSTAQETNRQYTAAQQRKTAADSAVTTAEQKLSSASSLGALKTDLDKKEAEWNAVKGGQAAAETAVRQAEEALTAAEQALTAAKNNSYRYVYESAAAGDATVKTTWEENSGRYLGTPSVRRIRTESAPGGSTNSSMNYIYCVAIKVNDRSATDSRDVFGQLTVRQTKGDRENRFDNVVLDLAVEIGYKSASDTDVGEGVIPEKPATFRRGDGFEQDSEFRFEFEADSNSSFVVNTIGQSSITIGLNTDPEEDIYDDILDEYPGAYVDFFNGNYATFNRTGTLYLAPSDGKDDYYVYSIDERNNVTRADATWDSSEDAYAIRTRTLGRYFLSSQRLSNSFLSSINGGSSGSSSSSGSGTGTSGSSSSQGSLVVVPAPSTTTTPSSSIPTYNPPASSSQASSSQASSSSSSSEPSSEPEEESSSEPEEEITSEPEEILDVDTDPNETEGPEKGGSALIWVLGAVGLLAAGGAVGFVIYNNKVRRDEDDGYSQYDEYDDDNDFPDDDSRD